MKRTILVTGGAGGIGEAICRELAKDHHNIAVNYLSSKDKALSLCEELEREYGIACLAIKADVSKEEEVDEMVSEIEKELGSVDVLVNCAGIDHPDLFHRKSAEQFRRILDVNVVGAYICAKRVAGPMKEKGWGRIINISSTNGINTYYPMCFDYDASKAALNSLTHNLAVQYAPEISVNAIAPGFIGTQKELEGYDEEFLKQACEKILKKRYGDPREVAYLVQFLISDKADYINNTILRIDGGQTGSV